MSEAMAVKDGDTEDGRRETYLALRKQQQDGKQDDDEEEEEEDCLQRLCGSLKHQMALMLTSMQWELTCVILVFIEVLINVVLMLIEFHVLKGDQQAASYILHFVGITILAVFVFEIFLKLFSMGPQYFWKEKIEIFDAFVVITAFVVEIVLSFYRPQKAWKSLAFVIALRMWRVFRVISNIIMFRGEVYELVTDEEDAGNAEENPPRTCEKAGETGDEKAGETAEQ